jgi:uncharacterized repeat protein (TIGR01451 family)
MRLGRAGGNAGVAVAACARLPRTVEVKEAVWPGVSRPAARLPMAARLSRHAKALLLFACAAPALAQTPSGTLIENVARLDVIEPHGTPLSFYSNAVSATVFYRNVTEAEISLLRYGNGSGQSTPVTLGPTLCHDANGNTSPMPTSLTVPVHGTIDVGGGSTGLVRADVFHAGEPMFIQVVDRDHDLDHAAVETVTVTINVAETGDQERLTLTETGPDTGVFAGYIQTSRETAVQRNCMLSVAQQSEIVVTYDDYEQISVAAGVLVDPFGIVFDSLTGAPVDGAVIQFINADTGLPAQVFGDDGVSTYPATLTSGADATDSSGAFYDFPAGFYRFPYAPPGNYRLVVTPPPGYVWPSQVPNDVLNALPGGPWALELGSRGEVFVIDPGPALHIDIPVTPLATGLFVSIAASQEIVALGDFVRFTVQVQNTHATLPAIAVALTDLLPPGFRLVQGSARYTPPGGVEAPIAPNLDAAGRLLNFPLGVLAPSTTGVVTFVAEVVPGVRTGAMQVNAHATASGGANSNVAFVQLTVRDELMRNVATLMGEVLIDACGKREDQGPFEGVANVRVLLEDGSYAVTDERGRFHFKGVAPGTHVVQLDTASLPEGFEAVPCKNNTRFAGRAWSQFVELGAGSLWRADFHLRRRPADKGALTAQLEGRLDGVNARYTLALAGSTVPVRNVRATVLLPEGATLAAGSVTLDGKPIEGAAEEGVMTLGLGDLGADWTRQLAFALVLPDAGAQELRAVVTFDSPSARSQRTRPLAVTLAPAPRETLAGKIVFQPRFATRKAVLRDEDKAELERLIAALPDHANLRFVVSGHTDSVQIAPENRHEYADNVALSQARAQAVAEFIVEAFGIPRDRIEAVGKGEHAPVADNATAEGRARNRRVEIETFATKRNGGGVDSGKSPLETVELTGKSRAERPQPPAQPDAKEAKQNYASYARAIDGAYLASLDAAPAILWPPADANPPIGVVKIAAKHAKGLSATLTVNGEDVGASHLAGTHANGAGVQVVEWTGVPVQEGDNAVVVTLRDASTAVVGTLERTVHFSGPAVRAELVPELSKLVADGREPPVLALRLFDRWGKPVRNGTSGAFDVSAPYEAYQSVEDLQSRQLMALAPREATYSVGDDGVALVSLMPTTVSGEALVTLNFNQKLRQEVRAWLAPEAREWVLVGLAEGSFGHNTVSKNAVEYQAQGGDVDYYEDGRVAFYAKGRVKGEYLLTVAYDTRRAAGIGGDQFDQLIDPNAYYTLYGDATEQRHDAASRENLYVKLERRQFYALFGDYDSGLTYTELGRYTRRLTGLKSEYRGERWSYTAFATENTQAFVKDELQGDGTSGLYRLSRHPLVVNTDRVVIEVRDRFHNETVLSRRELTRFADYSIDYLAGTLFFKEPVPSRDVSFNPIWIVAEYEVQSAGESGVTAGGRGAVKLAGDTVEIGATAIREGVQGAESDLYGADLRVRLGQGTEIRAEIAQSDATDTVTPREGDAYLAEVRHQGEKLSGRAYVREQDGGFGLGQQSGGETGTRKSGVEGAWRFGPELTADAQAYVQETPGTGARREVTEAALHYAESANKWSATGGVRRAADETAAGESVSEQAFVGGSLQLMDRVVLRATAEVGLSQQGASGDFPDRFTIGADYKLTDRTNLYAAHEIARGPTQDSDMTRIGVRTEPWAQARVDTSLTQSGGEYGPRTFATLGLTQGWKASDNLLLDFGFDRVKTIREPGATPLNPNVPPASGTTVARGDFTAWRAGATWRESDLTVASRFETLAGDNEDRWGVIVGALKQESDRLGYSASLSWIDSETAAGASSSLANLRLGASYRPTRGEWLLLDRLDLVYDDRVDAAGAATTTWKLINNVNANWMPNDRFELSLKHGLKLARVDLGGSYSGVTDLVGVEGRYDLSDRWDVGMHVGALHSWESDILDYGWGVSIGRDLFKNVWLSFGYNVDGYYDADFSGARWTARGPYIRFRIKFDQDSLRELPELDVRNPAQAPATEAPR